MMESISVQDGDLMANPMRYVPIPTKVCLYCDIELSFSQKRHHARYCCGLHRRLAWEDMKAERVERKRLDRKDELKELASLWCDDRPAGYGLLLSICFEYRNDGYDYITIALVFEVARCKFNLRLKNSFRPYIRERIIRDYPSLEDWLR